MLEDYLNYSAAGDQKILNYMLLSKYATTLLKLSSVNFQHREARYRNVIRGTFIPKMHTKKKKKCTGQEAFQWNKYPSSSGHNHPLAHFPQLEYLALKLRSKFILCLI